MTRSVLGLFVLLLLAPPAGAARLDLAWNRCRSDGGDVHRYFACDANDGGNVLVASFATDRDHPDIVSVQAGILVRTTQMLIPDWWKIDYAGSCRPQGLSARADLRPLPGSRCVTPWQGTASDVRVLYTTSEFPGPAPLPAPPADGAWIVLDFSLPSPVALHAGTEYHAFDLVLLDDHSTGADSCAGCRTEACLFFNSLSVTGKRGSEVIYIDTSSNDGIADWQCANGGFESSPYHPPWTYCEPIAGCTVAVRNRTWGQLKGLYR